MAKKKKKSQGGPISSAGLMRYFDTEGSSIKISPKMVIIASIVIAIVVMVSNLFV
jgi:preprotein translocase subunit Sec61beta